MNDIGHFNEILDNILIPRVVGTENHKKVKEYIVKELKDLKWTIELDEFDDKTPNMGTLTFTNIIAKLNPNADRYLVLACHYDSKYFPNDEFLGEHNYLRLLKFWNLTDFTNLKSFELEFIQIFKIR